jgi:hypothetical protein
MDDMRARMTAAPGTPMKPAMARSERLPAVTAARVRDRSPPGDAMQTTPTRIDVALGTGRKLETPPRRRAARKVVGRGART